MNYNFETNFISNSFPSFDNVKSEIKRFLVVICERSTRKQYAGRCHHRHDISIPFYTFLILNGKNISHDEENLRSEKEQDLVAKVYYYGLQVKKVFIPRFNSLKKILMFRFFSFSYELLKSSVTIVTATPSSRQNAPPLNLTLRRNISKTILQ